MRVCKAALLCGSERPNETLSLCSQDFHARRFAVLHAGSKATHQQEKVVEHKGGGRQLLRAARGIRASCRADDVLANPAALLANPAALGSATPFLIRFEARI